MPTPTIINGRSNLATDPIRNFRFLATFSPHASMKGVKFNTTVGFTSVSGLSVTTESIPYREGGYNTSVHQIPGQSSFSPITFQRGVVLGSRQNWDWMRQLYRIVNAGTGTGGTGVVGQDFRADVTIRVLQHPAAGSANSTGNTIETIAAEDDIVAARFKVYNAWPTALAFSDLNAGDNALLVEQMTLVHEGFDMTWSAGPGITAPNFTY
jgi:phage tail-like protein